MSRQPFDRPQNGRGYSREMTERIYENYEQFENEYPEFETWLMDLRHDKQAAAGVIASQASRLDALERFQDIAQSAITKLTSWLKRRDEEIFKLKGANEVLSEKVTELEKALRDSRDIVCQCLLDDSNAGQDDHVSTDETVQEDGYRRLAIRERNDAGDVKDDSNRNSEATPQEPHPNSEDEEKIEESIEEPCDPAPFRPVDKPHESQAAFPAARTIATDPSTPSPIGSITIPVRPMRCAFGFQTATKDKTVIGDPFQDMNG